MSQFNSTTPELDDKLDQLILGSSELILYLHKHLTFILPQPQDTRADIMHRAGRRSLIEFLYNRLKEL